MKKKVTTITVLLILLCFTVILSAGCGDNVSDSEDEDDIETYADTRDDDVRDAYVSKAIYSVVFNLNGGELVSGELEQEVEEGGAAVEPVVKNGTKSLTWDKDFSSISGNLIVNAVWSSTMYTVTFEPGVEGIEAVTVEVEEGSAASAPEFVADGLSFVGWDKSFDNVTENITVTAKWEKKTMTGAEIAEYAKTRVATVHVHNGAYDNDSTGSAFFIKDDGTLVTNYHVIEYADSLSVEMNDGGIYNVEKVLGFSEKYDLAVLKISIGKNEFFNISNEIVTGDNVYAIGSALGELTGTMTSGIISNTSRVFGEINCIQMDAAISHGNSGGPLLNGRGEVIGINSFTITDGESLNLAINIGMLDKLDLSMNYTVGDYTKWWRAEISRSYHATYISDNSYYAYTLINTYQDLIGQPCIASSDQVSFEITTQLDEGYIPEYNYFFYKYTRTEYEKYTAYLEDLGYVYSAEDSGAYSDGLLSTYYSFSSGTYVQLIVTNSSNTWGEGYLEIGVFCN